MKPASLLALVFAATGQAAGAACWPIFHDNGSVSAACESYTLLHRGQCVGAQCPSAPSRPQPGRKEDTTDKPDASGHCKAFAGSRFVAVDDGDFFKCLAGCSATAIAQFELREVVWYVDGTKCDTSKHRGFTGSVRVSHWSQRSRR